jgi:glycine/D-amino acid oxidase-like deaminating enzyme/nitrite reductase/ring-hydroxylating ferredoxin subunit
MSDQPVSPWVATAPDVQLGDTSFQAAQHEADVLVLGGGIAGLTTALTLQRAGRQVTVVDAGRIGRGVTGHSTVKVTVGHGTMLSDIASTLDEDAARVYAAANQAGLERIVALAGELGIDCDLERAPHVVYTRQPGSSRRIHEEAQLAVRLGLRAAVVDDVPLPFPVAAAVAFDDQVQFHPVAYLLGLAQGVVAAGGNVIENVRALAVSDRDPCRVTTTAGVLTARHVVVTTHYPFLDRGWHFARLKPFRSYGIAAPLPAGTPAGMTIGIDSPTRSTRTVQLDGERHLVVVGQSHPVGQARNTASRWDALHTWARQHFSVGEPRYRWSTQDLESVDHVPYVGWITPGSRRVLTATGFAGWGMTNGTAAGMLLADLVLERPNEWAKTFDARRLNVHATAGPLTTQNLQVAVRWVKDRVVRARQGAPHQLSPGEAAVLRDGAEPTAAYRDRAGVLHAVSARCTHLGCLVAWNDGERSWDCPCHGSRFDPTGAVLEGPATRALPPVDVARPG